MTVDIYETINNNIYNFPKKLPYVTVSSKGISNGLSTIYNDGADFGPDTYLGATTKNRYGPPYTQTSGILEATNYQQQNGGIIKMLQGRYIISPNAQLTQVNTSNYLGYPEYAVIPIQHEFSDTSMHAFNIEGIGGNIHPGGNTVANSGFDSNQLTLIDVSQLTNIPSNASVVLFGYNRLNVSNPAIISEVINMHNFAILTATPSTSGQNICGGYDFTISVNASVTNVSVYSANSISNPVFPAEYVIGQAIDGHWGGQCWIDNVASFGMSYGFIIGGHVQAGSIITQSCYYGIVPWRGHDSVISKYDMQACLYGIYISPALGVGSLIIQQWESEESGEINGTPVTDIYTQGSNATIIIENFHSIYDGGTPNPRLPVISTSYPAGYFPVIIKNIQTQLPLVSGPTAGNVQITVLEYTFSGTAPTGYKKMMFVFNGYENDTTTNQTIPFPSNSPPLNNQLSFVSTPVITANNTGLTITPSTTGITITSPNSTATYNGIVIIEGY